MRTKYRDRAETMNPNRAERHFWLIKHIVSLFLLLAVFEATAFQVVGNGLRLMLAIGFLLYGIWILVTFRQAAEAGASTQAPPLSGAQVAMLCYAIGILLYRIVFTLLALSFVLMAYSHYDKTIVEPTSSTSYLAFVLAVLKQMVPPLADALGYFIPTVQSAVWNSANSAVAVIKIFISALYAYVLVSAFREVWLLRHDVDELKKRLQRLQTREFTEPDEHED